MGVTTVAGRQLRQLSVEIGPALDKVRKAGSAISFATLVGPGLDPPRGDGRCPAQSHSGRARDDEGAGPARHRRRGRSGSPPGLQYVPGTYAETSEIVELARVACKAGGLYASHMRNEGTAIDASVAETIGVGEAVGLPGADLPPEIDSPKNWGAGRRALSGSTPPDRAASTSRPTNTPTPPPPRPFRSASRSGLSKAGRRRSTSASTTRRPGPRSARRCTACSSAASSISPSPWSPVYLPRTARSKGFR